MLTRARTRSLLAATAAAAVLCYGLSAHVLPQMGHDGMAGATVGLCLLLVTVVAFSAAPKPEAALLAVVTGALPRYAGAPRRGPVDARARASPSALQVFRN